MSEDLPICLRGAQFACESFGLLGARMVVGDEKLAEELFSPPYDRSAEERREFMRRHSNQLAGMYSSYVEGQGAPRREDALVEDGDD